MKYTFDHSKTKAEGRAARHRSHLAGLIELRATENQIEALPACIHRLANHFRNNKRPLPCP